MSGAMTTLQNKGCGKGPKRIFAPPAPKQMPSNPDSLKEDLLGMSSPKAKAKPNLSKAGLEKKNEKASTEKGEGSGQKKKGKNQHEQHVGKKAEQKGASLADAEFEEIVQIVLQKSLQECLEMSCAQPIGCIQSDKGPGITSITADNDNADGEMLVVTYTPETSASQDNKVVPLKASKPGQIGAAFSEKKFARLSLNRRKKGTKNEKLEKFQGRHEHRQKDQPNKTGRNCTQIREPQKGKQVDFGPYVVWVQCSSPNCEKWRRLHENIDPSVLPENWSCDQNTDMEYNRCDIPEETWIGHESDVAYASYIPGSIIWAKQYGYPWWPGMIESDPDLGEYFLFASHLDSLPAKYHVTFFGETVYRAWISANMLKNFQEMSLELAGVTKYKNKDYSQELRAALVMAQEAQRISIQDRVNSFGFHSRHNGFDSPDGGKDLMLSEPDNPDFCLEKEQEMGSETKEKDPTLPGPKPTKKQTRKSKPKDLPNGGGEVLQKKTKRSLEGESTVSAGLITASKEDQENSGTDQPGPKKKFQAPQSKCPVTSLSEERAVRRVSKDLAPPTEIGACPTAEEEVPQPQESRHQEAAGIPPEDEASSDLNLEQLLEDVGREPELVEEPQFRDEEGFAVALFEE